MPPIDRLYERLKRLATSTIPRRLIDYCSRRIVRMM